MRKIKFSLKVREFKRDSQVDDLWLINGADIALFLLFRGENFQSIFHLILIKNTRIYFWKLVPFFN